MSVRAALSLVVMLTLALPVGASNVAAQQGDASRDPRVDLRWSREFPARQEPGGVAVAPRRSYVLLSPRHRGYGLHLARYNHHGHEMWDQGWIGRDHRAVKSVQGEAVAVSARHHAVLIAGHATCKHQGDAAGALGPVFVRKYSLHGERRWTHWIGTCPLRSSQRRVPPLSASGLDVLGSHVAVSFTRGHSWDCCPHHRKGHVALLGLDGATKWRTTLDFPLSRVSEVVTNDVALSPDSLTVSGAVMWGSHGADAFLVNLARSNGSVRWSHVTSGAVEPNIDEYWDVDTVGAAVFASGILDNAFEGGGSRGVVERWSSSGERAWRVPARRGAAPEVAALGDRSVLWSKPVWRHKTNHFIFAELRPGGAPAWRVNWTLPDHDYPGGYAFDATRHAAFGAADIIHNNRSFLRAWCWHLR